MGATTKDGRHLFPWLEDLDALTQALVNSDPIPRMHGEKDEQRPQLRLIRGGLSGDAS